MRYLLRTRLTDDEAWSEPQEYESRRERDRAAQFNRIIGGIRVWSIDERERVERRKER